MPETVAERPIFENRIGVIAENIKLKAVISIETEQRHKRLRARGSLAIIETARMGRRERLIKKIAVRIS